MTRQEDRIPKVPRVFGSARHNEVWLFVSSPNGLTMIQATVRYYVGSSLLRWQSSQGSRYDGQGTMLMRWSNNCLKPDDSEVEKCELQVEDEKLGSRNSADVQ